MRISFLIILISSSFLLERHFVVFYHKDAVSSSKKGLVLAGKISFLQKGALFRTNRSCRRASIGKLVINNLFWPEEQHSHFV
jgi:hypothetical protein